MENDSGQQKTNSTKEDNLNMSRIPPVDNVQIPLEDGISFTTMSTLFRVMAQRPDLARHSIALLEAVMHGGTVDPKLKELLAVRVSQVNHCFY